MQMGELLFIWENVFCSVAARTAAEAAGLAEEAGQPNFDVEGTAFKRIGLYGGKDKGVIKVKELFSPPLLGGRRDPSSPPAI